jgi:hypothetical protein
MLDATVLVAGIGWPRWSYEVLRHAVRGDFQAVLSPLVVEQSRRHLAKIAPGRLSEFDQWLTLCGAELVPEPTQKEVEANSKLVRQAQDVPVALAGIAAQVDYFVSEDKDFTDEDATTAAVRRRLRVMRPVIFLREVMGWTSDELEEVRERTWLNLPPPQSE